ncbi:MAG: hypothetical protein R3324_01470 [Halobacteriales archaeon]|nr:hypothetical protein [Halobacteriales archaeon]
MGRVGRIGPVQALAELLFLAVIPVGLLGIHVLVPNSIREALVLDPAAPTIITLFTAAFVHLDAAHLLGNVVGVTIAVGYAYVLALIAGERRWFGVSVLAILLLSPVLVNASWVLVVRTVVDGLSLPVRGFSGVVASFGGLLFVALWVLVKTRRSRATANDVGWIGLLTMLGALEILYADPYLGYALGLTLLGIAISLGRLLHRGYVTAVLDTAHSRRALVRDLALIILAGVPLGILLFGLFPRRIAADGVITNVFAHFIGFAYGVVISRWVYRYWQRRPLFD